MASHEYFTHDYNARNDPKLIKVFMKLGHEGKSVFWDLIEMMYEQDGYLMLSHCDSYAFALHTHCDVITSLINDFDLFENDGIKFYSNSVLGRLNIRKEKSIKASNSARKRWNNANAERTQCDSMQSKVKESKGNNIDSDLADKSASNSKDLKTREKVFMNELSPYVSTYGKEIVRGFFNYWVEPNKPKTKMRFELEKTWDLSRRLSRWASKEKISISPKGSISDIEEIKRLMQG